MIQARTLVANVKALDIFGEYLSIGIGTEDPNRNPDCLPWFASLAHKFSGENRC